MLYFRIVAVLAVITAASATLSGPVVGKEQEKAAKPVPADLTLKDIDGKNRQPLACGDAKAAVLFFLTHDCPISNGYSPEINRICQAFGGAGKVSFHIIHPFAELNPEEARKHTKEYGYTVPVIIDTKKLVTRAVQAKMTPEAIVVSPAGEILYRGRIDDIWADYGKRRPAATVHDLRNALSAILAGKPVPAPVTEAIGCPIEQ